MKETYKKRIGKACDYISENLEDDLSLEMLSQVIEISKFHFHRLFAVHTGINVYNYILLQRLKRASYQLVFNKDIKIIDIAINAKFDSPEAFSRAFKKKFNVTPSEFRKKPNWEIWHKKYTYQTLTGEQEMEVKLINFEETQIAVLEHKGPPASLNNTIPKFIEWRKFTGLSPIVSCRTFGIVYNDPNNTPPEEFRFDVCGEIIAEVPENKYGVTQKTIPEGICAVIRHIGSHDTMDEKIYYLYRDWLPKSGKEIRDFPLYFQYHNFFPETAENELITDIFLPIK
ncbi:MAG: AraC family transcriptional regulator [Bacteriovorax sp.]|nr:AraC family transcriptional regulator [Bacteriovorax sp.]